MNPEALFRMLRSNDPDTRQHAAAQLVGHAADGIVEECLRAREGEWQRAAEVLAHFGPSVLPALQTVWTSPDPLLRMRSASLLAKVPGDEALLLLDQLLSDPQPTVRRRAVEALGMRMGSPPADQERLLAERTLGDADEGVRQSAARVLRTYPDIRSLEPLRAAAADRSPGVRIEIAAALGSLGDPRALPQLIGLLSDSISQVRWAAAEGLGRIPCRESVAALMGAMRSTDALLSQKAGVALVRVGAPAVAALAGLLSSRDGSLRSRAWIVLASIGAPSIPELCGALEHPEPHTRRAAAQALAHIARHEPHPELLRALPRLRKLCSPWALDGSDSVAAYRTALDLIVKATTRLKHLPLPSSAPLPSSRDLPVVAAAENRRAQDLPLPVVEPPESAPAETETE